MMRALLIALALFAPSQASPDDPLREWAGFAKSPESAMLSDWMRCIARERLAARECSRPLSVGVPPYFGRLGFFITLVKGSKVRGCFGAFHHKTEDAELTLREYINGALFLDPRYPPLDLRDLGETRIILTVAGELVPVDDINQVDFSRFGLMISFETGEKIVLVPSEIRSRDRLDRMIGSGTVVQCAVFRAVTIR
ncbi:MAG TPA: AMMECR1 domain-containing protein [Spirochaetota bacterium]|nr:AMMECR1 domain-containing protein [Spirochaetota bacterium]